MRKFSIELEKMEIIVSFLKALISVFLLSPSEYLHSRWPLCDLQLGLAQHAGAAHRSTLQAPLLALIEPLRECTQP